MQHHTHHHHQGTTSVQSGLNSVAAMATLHCLSGCAIGEVVGMIIGTALGWPNAATIALAVGLAFLSGYAFTLLPLLRSGMKWREASRTAFAADTASIAMMEVVDNLVMLLIPGAMETQPDSLFFWTSLLISMVLAGIAAFPLNRWLIARGQGHALAHSHH